MRQGAMSRSESELAEWVERSQCADVAQDVPHILIREPIRPAVHWTEEHSLLDRKIQFHIGLRARPRYAKIGRRDDQPLDLRSQPITGRSVTANTVLLENPLPVLWTAGMALSQSPQSSQHDRDETNRNT